MFIGHVQIQRVRVRLMNGCILLVIDVSDVNVFNKWLGVYLMGPNESLSCIRELTIGVCFVFVLYMFETWEKWV